MKNLKCYYYYYCFIFLMQAVTGLEDLCGCSGNLGLSPVHLSSLISVNEWNRILY